MPPFKELPMPVTHELAASALTDVLFEEPDVGRCLVAPDGSVLRVNDEWLRSTGFSRDDVLGEDIIGLFPDTRDMSLALHARARTGHRVEVPRHAQRIQGRETWWEGSIAPVPMSGGTGLLITARDVSSAALDVTDQRRAERALRESESRLRRFYDSGMIGVAHFDLTGLVTEANDKFLETVGYTREDLAARRITAAKMTPPEYRAVDERAVAELKARGVDTPYEKEFIRKDGSRVPVIIGAVTLEDAGHDGIAFILDNSERKRAEAALQQALEERQKTNEALDRERSLLASVMQATDVMLVYLDPAFNFVWVNAAYAATCSARPEELVGKNHFTLYPDAENEAIFRSVRDTGEPVFCKDKPFEFQDQPERGVTYWDWSLVPVKDASGTVRGLVFSLRETTKFKRAELELDAERMRWRGVVEGIADEVWVCDAGGTMSLINLPETTAMALEEFEGKTLEQVLEDVDIFCPDGRPRPPDQAPLLRSLRSGEIVRGEEKMRHRATGRERWRQFSCAPIRDGAGTITGAVAIVRDVTESKRIEETLREADRRKDEFLGMLSHELRNPLAPIRNSVYILRHTDAGREQAIRAQGVIERQTEHLTRIVDDLLDVTRIARGKIELRRTRVDLREVVSRAGDDFRLLLRDRGIGFSIDVPDVTAWADADPTRITQIVGNLLHNASKFTREGDEVTLSLRLAAGAAAEIRVKDTGAGIEPALLPKVFEPFVQGERTLARTEGGLGLGLALVKGIAELHGGTVRVESAGKGKGAQFTVTLPLARDARVDPQERGGRVRATGARRVLVIDDNADAADSLAEIAALFGHIVEVAHDGPSGLRKAGENPPDVVLCDLGLPGMSGYDVAKALRARSPPRIQLVAVSGYTQPEDVKRAIEAGFDEHLAKPADPARLERVLNRC